MISRPRIFRLAFFATLLLALIGYGLWWALLARQLRGGIEQWAARQTAAGWTVTTGSPSIEGFPGAVRLVLPNPSVADGEGDGWHGPELTLTLLPWAPGHLSLSAPGRHMVSLPDGAPVELAMAEATGRVILQDGGWKRVDLLAGGIDGAGLAADRLSISVTRLAMTAVDHHQAALKIVADLAGLTLPDDPRLALGRKIANGHVEAQIMGSLPGGAVKPALAAWRDDGGVVEIAALALNWPPLVVSGQGTVALDGRMQPLLAFNCTLGGLFPTLDLLTKAGLVRSKDTATVRMVLGLLARPAADGTPQITAPLSLQDQVLYLGPVAIMTVPDLVW